MEKIITYDTLRSFAYSSDRLVKGEIKGIILHFNGLNNTTMLNTDPGDALEYAEKGIIYVVPYCAPWSWMSRQAVAYTDEIVSVLCEKYGLGDTVRIASTGGSMGGLAALVYTAYARITPTICVANCPVCDLPYHYTERPDLPRTLYSAFAEYDGDLETAMRTCSPLHLVDKMPDIPYTVFHCSGDKSVNLEKHSKRFVEEMKVAHKIDFNIVPFRGHCDLSAEAKVQYKNTILSAFL